MKLGLILQVHEVPYRLTVHHKDITCIHIDTTLYFYSSVPQMEILETRQQRYSNLLLKTYI